MKLRKLSGGLYRGLKTLLIISLLGISYTNCSKRSFSPIQDNNGILNSLSPGINDMSGQTLTLNADLKATGNKLDIILVIDDSGSMKDDSSQLASRLSAFVQKLSTSGVDWQMCWTDTNITTSDAGLPKSWTSLQNPSTGLQVVNGLTPNLATVFTDTINSISFNAPGSGDERGVGSLRLLVDQRSSHSCLRTGAALTSIVISDEDERSVGGDPSRESSFLQNNPKYSAQYAPIEDIDRPESLIAAVTKAGVARYVANSIVIRSNDTVCLALQVASNPSFYGTFYERLSSLTNGGVGSICDANYSTNLNLFFDRILNGFRSIKLACTAVPGSVRVTANQPASTYSYTVQPSSVDFNLLSSTAVYGVEVSYTCQ